MGNRSPYNLKNIMSENTQTQFKAEGDLAFSSAENTENGNSAESSTEKTDANQTPSSKENKNQTDENKGSDDKGHDNFSDHPRWKEREDDWKSRFNDQEKRHTDEIEKLRQDFDKRFGEVKPKDKTEVIDMPSWFGGTVEDWKLFQDWNKQQIAQVKELAVKEVSAKSEEEQKRIDAATKYFNDTVTTIEIDKTMNPQGLKVDRNKLLKFVLDNDIVDSKGNWNYKVGWQLMQQSDSKSKSKSTDEKKQVASATTSDNRADTKPSAFRTSEDFSNPTNRPW